MAYKRFNKSPSKRPPKTTKVKVLKVKFQNLGENGAEANFRWEPRSGSFIPHAEVVEDGGPMPWET